MFTKQSSQSKVSGRDCRYNLNKATTQQWLLAGNALLQVVNNISWDCDVVGQVGRWRAGQVKWYGVRTSGCSYRLMMSQDKHHCRFLNDLTVNNPRPLPRASSLPPPFAAHKLYVLQPFYSSIPAAFGTCFIHHSYHLIAPLLAFSNFRFLQNFFTLELNCLHTVS